MAAKGKPSFEKSLKELEKIVSALESGDLTLEKALKKIRGRHSIVTNLLEGVGRSGKKSHLVDGRRNRYNARRAL